MCSERPRGALGAPAWGRLCSALLLLCAVCAACGFLGDPGEEPRGDENLPVNGVGKFEKQDFWCNAEFIQPFLVLDPVGSASRSGEPCVVASGDQTLRLWFERRSELDSRIHTGVVRLGPGTGCRDVDASLPSGTPEIEMAPAPAAPVGAPTVLAGSDGLYRMWFEVGDAESIGYAESDDGVTWTVLSEAVLGPNQAWEAGETGSPSVLYHEGLFRMWYDGAVTGARAIGYAWSPDGLAWTKADASGNEAPGVGSAGGAEVDPVLRATQTNWEFWYPDPSDPRHVGRVGQPCVIVHHTPLRTLYLLYYTGNLKGALRPHPLTSSDATRDASIGLAASDDGLHWQKAPSYSVPEVIANEINPIMDEKLAVTLDPNRPAGSINVFNPIFVLNEAAPAVAELVPNQFFVLLWHQVDWANLELVPEMAPVDPDQGPSGFGGGAGIGFSYTGNPPF